MTRHQALNISSGTIVRFFLILLAFWFVFIIRDVVLMMMAAVVIASAIEPIAKRLQAYRIPRALSVGVVYVGGLALLGLGIAVVMPPLAHQVGELAQRLPQDIQRIQQRAGFVSTLVSEGSIPQLQTALSSAEEGLRNLGGGIITQTRNVFSGLFALVFVFVIALYLVLEEDALKKAARLIVHKQHQPYALMVLDRIQEKLGRWVLGQLALAIVIGVVVGTGLWIMGVPYALALGLLAGFLEIIPVIGPIVSGFVAILAALTQSFFLGIGVLIFFIVVQQLENNLLVPNIMKRATGLNPLVTLFAVLIGGRLAGLAGVILSVPIATIISIFLSDFFSTKHDIDELAG